MKAERIEMNQERDLLMRMVTSTEFLRAILPVVKTDYFKSSYARLVAGWVLEYWDQYKTAPGPNIQTIYQRKINELGDDEETQDVLETFLVRLSKDYVKGPEQLNIPFLVGEAESYLKLRSLEELRDRLDVAIVEKNLLEGEQLIANFKRVETSGTQGTSILKDAARVAAAFLEEDEVLFKLPGAVGEVLGNFSRQDLVAFLAASKRGKSWWAMYCAQIAMNYGWKVVYFNLEMADNQPIRRFWHMLMGQPRKTQEVTIPYFTESDNSSNDKPRWTIETKVETREGLDLSQIKTVQKNLRKRSRAGNIRIYSVPAYSATIEDLNAMLDNLTYFDEYIPDVIVVDQADLVAPSKLFKGEYRHMLDDIWKKLRRMAQERNALVITPTQAGRPAFKGDAGEADIAEDIRKITHVAKMVAINQSKKDRQKGVVRLQMLAERDGKMTSEQVVCLQSLDIGRVHLDSRMISSVDQIKDDD